MRQCHLYVHCYLRLRQFKCWASWILIQLYYESVSGRHEPATVMIGFNATSHQDCTSAVVACDTFSGRWEAAVWFLVTPRAGDPGIGNNSSKCLSLPSTGLSCISTVATVSLGPVDSVCGKGRVVGWKLDAHSFNGLQAVSNSPYNYKRDKTRLFWGVTYKAVRPITGILPPLSLAHKYDRESDLYSFR